MTSPPNSSSAPNATSWPLPPGPPGRLSSSEIFLRPSVSSCQGFLPPIASTESRMQTVINVLEEAIEMLSDDHDLLGKDETVTSERQ